MNLNKHSVFIKIYLCNFENMNKWVHTIGIIVLLAAFLVSVTGFRLVKHSCQVCEIVEFSITDSSGCCEVEATKAKASLPPASCCSTEDVPVNSCQSTCCNTIEEYFVTNYTINILSSGIPVSFLNNQPIDLLAQPFAEIFVQGLIPPEESPGNTNYGKQFLVSIHQLKIDCLIC